MSEPEHDAARRAAVDRAVSDHLDRVVRPAPVPSSGGGGYPGTPLDRTLTHDNGRVRREIDPNPSCGGRPSPEAK